jgi:hypothetical protein
MALFDRGLVDYRIGVTTTDVINDKGELIGGIVSPSLSDPVATFQRNVRVGTDGKGHEEAFEAARLAIVREQASAAEVLEKRAVCQGTCALASNQATCSAECEQRYEPAFMRPGAHLYIVFVSDEEEQSFGEVRYFQRFFETALGVGNEDAVSVATICGDVPVPACQAQPGTRYAELAQATGGIVASICDATFESHLQRLALDAAGLKRKFALSEPADPETLDLEVRYRCDTPAEQIGTCASRTDDCNGRAPDYRGILCEPPAGETDGWTYEPASRSLFFHGAAIPGLRSELVVSYQEAGSTGS